MEKCTQRDHIDFGILIEFMLHSLALIRNSIEFCLSFVPFCLIALSDTTPYTHRNVCYADGTCHLKKKKRVNCIISATLLSFKFK